MLASHEQVRLRKRLLSILRQNSEYVQLYYDTYGYTPVEPLLAYLRTLKGCETTTRSDLREVVESDQGHYFEWDQGALIRATHGFLPVKTKGRLAEVAPPDTLYYGTHRKLLRQVMAGGLLPIASEYVQLSHRVEAIGLPHDTLSLVAVRAEEAYRSGVRFYQTCTPYSRDDPYYFSDAISPAYLEPM
ncbi:RNA 2'-phosphotransferase [Brevibacillus choshinensis]|uniref:RNA 2'-phosphotransferase n=1 Tax=Brevibacillus choshinensis TaxID=54911 RepID=A0ABX7FK29_BRECH|nr:RNA 2'-phosphotransferase [Brevibacillus choshinensis]QRG65677.1 RNA 2'-phosphotransferase [Brevibacillus choshinensis]